MLDLELDDACIVSTGIYVKLNRNCATNSNMPKTSSIILEILLIILIRDSERHDTVAIYE